jgi:hypothetical protein
MPLRAIRRRAAPALLHDVDEAAGRSRPASVDGSVLADPDFLASLLLPELVRVEVAAGDEASGDEASGHGDGEAGRGGWQRWLLGQDGSWAHDNPARRSRAIATQAGPRRLWDALEAAHAAWDNLGRPHRHQLGLTVTADGRHLLWHESAGHPPIAEF